MKHAEWAQILRTETQRELDMSRAADYRVSVPIMSVLAEPSEQAVCTSEGLYGERLALIERHGQWLQVQQLHDGYQGFVSVGDVQPLSHVSPLLAESTHRVHTRSTLLFSEPNIKSTVKHRLPFGSELALVEAAGEFSLTACKHYVWNDHCLPLKQICLADPLSLASTHFLGCPYRWGGRTPEGADCSGLIQQLARSQGLFIPRDSVDQEQAIPASVPAGQYLALDLVFWPGHVGILVSADELLHATANSLNCLVEPLQNVIDRAGPVSSVKRLFE